jgi:protein phosphatase
LSLFAIFIAGGFAIWWQVRQTQIKSIPSGQPTQTR